MAYEAARSRLSRPEEPKRFFPLPPSHSLPLHLNPLPSPTFRSFSSTSSSAGRFDPGESAPDRLSSSLRLLAAWESLAQRYTAVPVAEDDEWDIETGTCVRFGGLLDREVGLDGREFGGIAVKEEDEDEDEDTPSVASTSVTASVLSSPPPPSASSAGEESDADDDLGGWATEQFGPLVLHVPPPPRGGALPARREGMKVEDLADLDAFLLADGVRERLPSPEPAPAPRAAGPSESWALAVKYEELGSSDDEHGSKSGSSEGESDADDWDEIDFISETFTSPFVSAASSSVPRRPGRPKTLPVSSALLPRRPFVKVKRESSCVPSLASSTSSMLPPPLNSTPGWRSSLLAKPSTSPLDLLAQRAGSSSSVASSSSPSAEWSTPSSSIPPAYSSSPLVRCAALFESGGSTGLRVDPSPHPYRHGQSPPPAKRQRLSLEPQGDRSTSMLASVKAELTSSSPLAVARGGQLRPSLAASAPPSRIPVFAALRRARSRPLGLPTAADAALARRAEREPSPPQPPLDHSTLLAAVNVFVKAEPSTLDVEVVASVVPVKRGRGRPRKHPLPTPAGPTAAAEPNADASHQVKTELLDAVPVVVKRPRGRPRKHPLPVPLAPTVIPADPEPVPAPAMSLLEAVSPQEAPAGVLSADEDKRRALALELFGSDDDAPFNSVPTAVAPCARPPAEELSETERDRQAKAALALELFGDEANEDDVLVIASAASRPTSPAAMGGIEVLDDDGEDDPLAGYDVW